MALAAVIALLAPAQATREAPAALLAAVLPSEAVLAARHWHSLEDGRAVIEVPDAEDRREVVTVSVLRVEADAARAAQVLRDVAGRRGEPALREIGVLGAPPAAADLAGLTLEARDRRSLERCRAGRCDVRLSGAYMELFREAVDWHSARGGARAEELWREMLAAYARAYTASGPRGLAHYDDDTEPVPVAEALESLVERSGALSEAGPELQRHLRQYPDARPAGVHEVLYWQREAFWRKSVTSLHHLAVLERDTPAGRTVVAADAQLYANHFFDAALVVTLFLERAGGSYVVQIGHARADIRPSGFTWLERLLLRRLVRKRLAEQTAALRARLAAANPTLARQH
jgi:hypothetical protein